MYLFNSFCYSDLTKLINAVNSTRDINTQILSLNPLSYLSLQRRFVNGIKNTYPNQVGLDVTNSYVQYDQFQNPISSSWLKTEVYIPYCNYPGHYVQDMNITLQNPSDNFNPSNLNPVDVFNSIGSGFLLVAVPLAVVWAGRHFLRPLFSK